MCLVGSLRQSLYIQLCGSGLKWPPHFLTLSTIKGFKNYSVTNVCRNRILLFINLNLYKELKNMIDNHLFRVLLRLKSLK